MSSGARLEMSCRSTKLRTLSGRHHREQRPGGARQRRAVRSAAWRRRRPRAAGAAFCNRRSREDKPRRFNGMRKRAGCGRRAGRGPRGSLRAKSDPCTVPRRTIAPSRHVSHRTAYRDSRAALARAARAPAGGRVGVARPLDADLRRARPGARGRRRRRQRAPRLRRRHRHAERRPRATPRSSRPRASSSTASPTPASWSRPTSATSRWPRSSTRSLPGGGPKKTMLANSGAEAVENAVKIARRAHRPAGGGALRARLPRPHPARPCR